MKRQAFCIHGHFYQPPREDPLTDEIPLEPGAAPFNNWNERIHAQCYKPNADLGNFEHISFNLGPTLAHWMESYDAETLKKIIDQDRANQKRYGVGNAMAQPYSHSILPLATRVDKITQVRWGIADFKHRFGHHPAGMWLPETAVDSETLEVLVECKIDFTVLAPWQADDDQVDVMQPYRVMLKDDQSAISVFFYHSGLSSGISFTPALTVDADTFVEDALLPEFANGTGKITDAQILLIASDGELYGHHQPFREMFLRRLVDGALEEQPIEPIYLALWLQAHPPRHTMEIQERTSWSCHHGVERWCGECACTPYGQWKAPLRDALNRIAEGVDAQFILAMRPYMEDPWELRHRYIHVLQEEITLEELVGEVIGQKLDEELMKKLHLLLQAQFERQRMFTSCGWFFDDFDRIEPRNNIAYAAEAVRLTHEATGINLAPQARIWLQKVKSWRSGLWASTFFNYQLERIQSRKQ